MTTAAPTMLPSSPLSALPRWLAWLKPARNPDFIIGAPDDDYLRRWHLLPRNRWFNLYLHEFVRSDDDRALHDHPYASASIILAGGYWEHMGDGSVTWRRPGAVVLRGATVRHRVELSCRSVGPGPMAEAPAWSLFITGPRVREWGFWCPQGWRHWRDFTTGPSGHTIGKGCD